MLITHSRPCHELDILGIEHEQASNALSILPPPTMASDDYNDHYLTYQQPSNLSHAMDNQHTFYQSQPFNNPGQSLDFSGKR